VHSNISHANYAIESFRFQDIKLSVTFDDETTRDVALTPSMVQNAHLDFVNQPGRHSIHVHYMGHDAIINVVLYEAQKDRWPNEPVTIDLWQSLCPQSDAFIKSIMDDMTRKHDNIVFSQQRFDDDHSLFEHTVHAYMDDAQPYETP